MPEKIPFWIVSPKNFISLIGAEYELMYKAGGSVLKRFYLSAVCVVVIMFLSFVSIWYAVTLLTHIAIVEFILSTFLSLLFVFIYIFLINTFTKENKGRIKGTLLFSHITRISFVLFIAFLISKPIEILVFRRTLDGNVENYKQKLLADHKANINTIFNTDLFPLQKRLQSLETQSTTYSTHAFDEEMVSINQKIDSISKKEMTAIDFTNRKIQTSGYFIYRIRQVYKQHPVAWLITLAVIMLFGLPVFLIYSISGDANYFSLKKEYEKNIIKKEYDVFSEKYTAIFEKNFNIRMEFYSKYKDPPFNTQLKESHSYKAQKEFVNKYCPD